MCCERGSPDDDLNEPFEPDGPPSEPPETLHVLEHQRYISKLIHWGFEAPNLRFGGVFIETHKPQSVGAKAEIDFLV